MICVGDRLAAKPFTSDKVMTGRVVYVHPSQRWYTLEFVTEFMGKRGKYREAFFSQIPRLPMSRKGYRRQAGR